MVRTAKRLNRLYKGSVSDCSNQKASPGSYNFHYFHTKMQGEKEFVTDASGIFKANPIPAGEVTIVLEKKGYIKPTDVKVSSLKPGMSIKLNFDIKSDDEDSEVFHPLLRMMEGG
jgi:hypothetical protein